MADIPIIQVLDKEHYFTQKLLSLPDEDPSKPLAPSSLRLRTKALSLSSNNFVYAQLGFAMGWWDFHPLPPSTPAPYNDASTYGRTNAWGYMEVLESTLPSVAKGSFLYGYLPIGTLAQDLQFEDGATSGQIIATSEHRRGLMKFYNQYAVYGPEVGGQLAEKSAEISREIVFRPMLESAFLMANYMFAPNPEETVLKSMGDVPLTWDSKRADISDATLVFLAPGSKVGLALAHFLKHGDRAGNKPKRIIGAPSDYSKEFVEKTGLYDEVVSTSGEPIEILSRLGVAPGDKLVIVNFGGRGGMMVKWMMAVSPVYTNLLVVSVGAEIAQVSPEEVKSFMSNPTPDFFISFSAPDTRGPAIEKTGEGEYLGQLRKAAASLQKSSELGEVKVQWGDGMEAVEKGWDDLSKGAVPANTGLAFLL